MSLMTLCADPSHYWTHLIIANAGVGASGSIGRHLPHLWHVHRGPQAQILDMARGVEHLLSGDVEVVGVPLLVHSAEGPHGVGPVADVRLNSFLGGVTQEGAKQVAVYMLCQLDLE